MSKSICRSYKTYKHIYCWEDYIVKLSKANRIVLTNLRTTDKLPITACRYVNIRRKDRICEKCNAR